MRARGLLLTVIATCAAQAATAQGRPVTQTLVFDAVARESFVDRPPVGPSPGDAEHAKARLRDAAGRFVGTSRTTCVFTKAIANDMLEHCSASAETSEGSVTLSGVGHLRSLNPPWKVTGHSGAYKGVRGKLIFETDIPLDPNVPLAAGRGFSVDVLKVTSPHPLHVGVVSRPAANAGFIRRANRACDATQAKSDRLPGFPFTTFDPFHPDPKVLPKVGRFFNQPARRRLPSALLRTLTKLGQPPAGAQIWNGVLAARKRQLRNEGDQIKAALADHRAAFVRSVFRESRDFNTLVFRSAVFGVQSCTFG